MFFPPLALLIISGVWRIYTSKQLSLRHGDTFLEIKDTSDGLSRMTKKNDKKVQLLRNELEEILSKPLKSDADRYKMKKNINHQVDVLENLNNTLKETNYKIKNILWELEPKK